MPKNTAGLQRQIVRGLSEDDFRRLCLEYFPDVYDNLTSGMSKNRMVELLLERVRKYDSFTNLQAALHQMNPHAFAYVEIVTSHEVPVRDPRQIFISHAHQDYGWAQRLAGDLEAHGWRVWIAPDSIRPGEKWVEAISRGLDESGVFVLLLTEFAVASHWVRDETNVAIEMQREGELQFVPLQFRPCRLPALWRTYQRIPFRAGYDRGLSQLLASIDPEHTALVQGKRPPRIEFVEPQSIAPAVPKAVLAELLSGDRDRIKTAVRNLEPELRDILQALQNALIAVVEDGKRSVAERVSAGDALGYVGDPRPGVCTLEPDLIPIEGQLTFLMGKEKKGVTIPKPFVIARYPVTNAQFRFFVEDGGYTEKWQRCWTEDGLHYWREYRWKQPRGWGDARYNLDNQPAVGISWYEALAYVNWLASTTNKYYRLPTEAEWERAARHTDGRIYPWGDEWQEGFANSDETHIERPTAVGIFPASRAVCGVLDMSGNVWEWCQTRWRDENQQDYDPIWQDDGRENLTGDNSVWRVLKGGSWYSPKGYMRPAARDGGVPGDRGSGTGFRCCYAMSSLSRF